MTLLDYEQTSRSSYDEIPYESTPIARTHPHNIAAVSALFGLTAPRPSRARILELGCGSGANLLSIAASLPQSTCLGVDLALTAIEQGDKIIARAGLNNLRLEAMNLLDFDRSLGEFDYIICHGVISWVPRSVQKKIFEICAANLSPNGIAFVSYNTLPGWHIRGLVREAMVFHTKRLSAIDQKASQARAFIKFMVETSAITATSHAAALQKELEHISKLPDWYIAHDFLEEVNEPLYFHDFADRADSAGLSYVSDAQLVKSSAIDLPAEAQRILGKIAENRLDLEQYFDFLRNTMFRRSLLSRKDRQASQSPQHQALFEMWIGSNAQEDRALAAQTAAGSLVFRTPNGAAIQTADQDTISILRRLAAVFPEPLHFSELLRGTEKSPSEISAALLSLALADLLELYVEPPAFSITAQGRPLASPLAREQIKSSSSVTNLKHEIVALDLAEAGLLPCLNGTQTIADLSALELPASGESPETAESVLRRIGGKALLFVNSGQ